MTQKYGMKYYEITLLDCVEGYIVDNDINQHAWPGRRAKEDPQYSRTNYKVVEGLFLYDRGKYVKSDNVKNFFIVSEDGIIEIISTKENIIKVLGILTEVLDDAIDFNHEQLKQITIGCCELASL